MRICIIGGGLTSLALAKALVNQNIYVDLLGDKKKQIIDQSRTIGITKSNIEYFNNNIVGIDKIIWKLNKIEIFSEKLKKEKLLKFQNHNQELFGIVKSFDLYNILEKSLKGNMFLKRNNLKNLTNVENKYDLLINLNFSNLISKKYFAKKVIKKYKSLAYTVILKHEKIDNNIAKQIFTKIGPLAFLPLSDIETSIVYSIKDNSNIKKEKLIELINLYNPKYKIKKINKISSFELSSINLRNYYYKNILAFGDLLHRIHPLAGQGFNMTIRDIRFLIDLIKNKTSLGLPIDQSICTEFEKKIKHKNFLFTTGIDLVYELFNFERKLDGDLLSKSIQIAGKNSSLHKILTKIADVGI